MASSLRNRMWPVVALALLLLVALAAAPIADARRSHAHHQRVAHKKKVQKRTKKAARKKDRRAAHPRKRHRSRRGHPKKPRNPQRHAPRAPRPPATERPALAAPSRAPTAAPAPGVPPVRGPLSFVSPFPADARVFAANSVWNQPLPADAPLDPRSADLIAALRGELHREIDTKTGPWINTSKWSVPVYTVAAGVPSVHVTLDAYKPALQRDFAAVPIPVGAQPAAGTDGHMVVYQPSTDTLWEFYRARQAADGWHARWGGKMSDVASSSGIFGGSFGATATSLPLLGGLMTIAELRSGRIDHALALALPTTAAGTYTWPAQRSDGHTTGPSAIPEGTRFRIDPSLNVDALGLSPVALAMAHAAQRYGIILRDGGSNIAFYGEDPTPSGGNPYSALFRGRYPNQVLAGFPWDRLVVVAPSG